MVIFNAGKGTGIIAEDREKSLSSAEAVFSGSLRLTTWLFSNDHLASVKWQQ